MFSSIKKIKRMDSNSFCCLLIILSDYICLNPRTVYKNQETFEFCEHLFLQNTSGGCFWELVDLFRWFLMCAKKLVFRLGFPCMDLIKMLKSGFWLIETPNPEYFLPFSVDRGRKLNVHKTFRRRPGRLLNVLSTFNLCPVSMRLLLHSWYMFITFAWKLSILFNAILTFKTNRYFKNVESFFK